MLRTIQLICLPRQAISPYFAVDFLLPRTYVASLSFYHLSSKIDIELLPTDAVLGYPFKTFVGGYNNVNNIFMQPYGSLLLR
jgi:hypothetical protein